MGRARDLLEAYRVHVLHPDSLASAPRRLVEGPLQVLEEARYLEEPLAEGPAGYRGILVTALARGDMVGIQFLTMNMLRWLIWARDSYLPYPKEPALRSYAILIGLYLRELDRGQLSAPRPEADPFGLPDSLELYAPVPPFVIQGYANYRAFLEAHQGIRLPFLRGVAAFVPTGETIAWFLAHRTQELFPNKELPRFQEEVQEFLERGGDFRSMVTVSQAAFDTLPRGTYFFAVGRFGRLRVGQEIPREEVERIEVETGRKVPRANHALLFPGEVVAAIGEFRMAGPRAGGKTGAVRIVSLNAGSGHYFYSNIRPSIREDVIERSDYYFRSLGHLFPILDSLGVNYQGVLISKF